VAFSLNEAQNRMLHQLLGISTSFRGNLRKQRFLLGGEMYFHALQDTGKTALTQCLWRSWLPGWLFTNGLDGEFPVMPIHEASPPAPCTY
jgi:hypothetical protein